MRSAFTTAGFVVASVFVLTATASADSITIYGTGLDSSGNVLSSGVDANYTLDPVSYALGGFGPYVVNPVPSSWVPDTATSAWITAGLGSGLAATTTYSTTFDLTGFYVYSVTITGEIATEGTTTVSLNGVALFTTSTASLSSFESFSISSTFDAPMFPRLNTLSFTTQNDSDLFSSLQIQLSADGRSDFQVEPGVGNAPEPSTILLWSVIASTIGAVSVRNRLKKRAATA
jgi:hypothetical protein